jgi:hypothetical protein
MLSLDQKPLYPRVQRLMKTLRTRLESRGIHGDEVLAAIGRGDADASQSFGEPHAKRIRPAC